MNFSHFPRFYCHFCCLHSTLITSTVFIFLLRGLSLSPSLARFPHSFHSMGAINAISANEKTCKIKRCDFLCGNKIQLHLYRLAVNQNSCLKSFTPLTPFLSISARIHKLMRQHEAECNYIAMQMTPNCMERRMPFFLSHTVFNTNLTQIKIQTLCR